MCVNLPASLGQGSTADMKDPGCCDGQARGWETGEGPSVHGLGKEC